MLVYSRLNVWGKERELPEIPRESFKQWYKRNNPKKGGENGQG
jgi:L-lactate dehydrogenase complex protein LldF